MCGKLYTLQMANNVYRPLCIIIPWVLDYAKKLIMVNRMLILFSTHGREKERESQSQEVLALEKAKYFRSSSFVELWISDCEWKINIHNKIKSIQNLTTYAPAMTHSQSINRQSVAMQSCVILLTVYPMLCAMVVTFLVYTNFCSFFNSSMNLHRKPGAGDGIVSCVIS